MTNQNQEIEALREASINKLAEQQEEISNLNKLVASQHKKIRELENIQDTSKETITQQPQHSYLNYNLQAAEPYLKELLHLANIQEEQIKKRYNEIVESQNQGNKKSQGVVDNKNILAANALLSQINLFVSSNNSNNTSSNTPSSLNQPQPNVVIPSSSGNNILP